MDVPFESGYFSRAAEGSEAAVAAHVNVGRAERMASAVAGGFLAVVGLVRRTPGTLALAAAGGALLFRGATGKCPVYSALGISTAAAGPVSSVRITRSVTIGRPRSEVYRFWRDLENLPTFMRHLESVQALDDRRSRWTAQFGDGASRVSWEAEIVEDRPEEMMGWHSLPGADLHNAGSVRFVDAPGEGTELHVTIEYCPATTASRVAASLLNPVFSQMVKEDLRRCKHLMEAGEIPTVEGQPAGR